MNLETTLLKLKELLNSWNLGPTDWFLALHYADMLNGYDIKYERDEHLHIMIPRDKIPWPVEKDEIEGEIGVPLNTQHVIDFQKFIKETGWDFHVLVVSRKLFEELRGKHTVAHDISGQKVPIITVLGNFVFWQYSVPIWSKQLSKDSVLRRFVWIELLLEKAKEKGDKKIVKMAKDLIRRFKPHADDSDDVEQRKKSFEKSGEFAGISACGGNVTGVVFKIENPDRPPEVKNDMVLVTKLVGPKLMSHVLASRAVITEEGGLTSHAAIVCRELKKVCIVGTKIATKVLKDGDEVEVDAERGIVRKLLLRDKSNKKL